MHTNVPPAKWRLKSPKPKRLPCLNLPSWPSTSPYQENKKNQPHSNFSTSPSLINKSPHKKNLFLLSHKETQPSQTHQTRPLIRPLIRLRTTHISRSYFPPDPPICPPFYHPVQPAHPPTIPASKKWKSQSKNGTPWPRGDGTCPKTTCAASVGCSSTAHVRRASIPGMIVLCVCCWFFFYFYFLSGCGWEGGEWDDHEVGKNEILISSLPGTPTESLGGRLDYSDWKMWPFVSHGLSFSFHISPSANNSTQSRNQSRNQAF